MGFTRLLLLIGCCRSVWCFCPRFVYNRALDVQRSASDVAQELLSAVESAAASRDDEDTLIRLLSQLDVSRARSEWSRMQRPTVTRLCAGRTGSSWAVDVHVLPPGVTLEPHAMGLG